LEIRAKGKGGYFDGAARALVAEGECMKQFKVGDWIIATKVFRSDLSYAHKPIIVCAITEHHILYSWHATNSDSCKYILPICELEGRAFVVADKCLIGVSNRDHSPNYPTISDIAK